MGDAKRTREFSQLLSTDATDEICRCPLCLQPTGSLGCACDEAALNVPRLRVPMFGPDAFQALRPRTRTGA